MKVIDKRPNLKKYVTVYLRYLDRTQFVRKYKNTEANTKNIDRLGFTKKIKIYPFF